MLYLTTTALCGTGFSHIEHPLRRPLSSATSFRVPRILTRYTNYSTLRRYFSLRNTALLSYCTQMPSPRTGAGYTGGGEA